MQDRWIMVRLDRHVHAKLCLAREALLRAAEQGKRSVQMDNRDRTSLSYVIDFLLEFRADYVARRLKAKYRARLRGKNRKEPRGPIDGDEDSDNSPE